MGRASGSLRTGLAQRCADQPGNGLGFFGAFAPALVRCEGRLGHWEWLVGQPDMDEETDEDESNHEELVKQRVRRHDAVLFHGDERGPFYRIRPLLHYPLHSHTRPVNVPYLRMVTYLTIPLFSHVERVACLSSFVFSSTLILPTIPPVHCRVHRNVSNRVTSYVGHPTTWGPHRPAKPHWRSFCSLSSLIGGPQKCAGGFPRLGKPSPVTRERDKVGRAQGQEVPHRMIAPPGREASIRAG